MKSGNIYGGYSYFNSSKIVATHLTVYGGCLTAFIIVRCAQMGGQGFFEDKGYGQSDRPPTYTLIILTVTM